MAPDDTVHVALPQLVGRLRDRPGMTVLPVTHDLGWRGARQLRPSYFPD